MLKQLAPRVVMPPSPKKSAWIASATERAKIEPQGPSTMAATPTPTACPEVPPGRGMLNIMITKENAANTEISGMVREASTRLIRRRAQYQPALANR